jgi:hypothetical protein
MILPDGHSPGHTGCGAPATSATGGGAVVRAGWATMVANNAPIFPVEGKIGKILFGCCQIQRLGAVAVPVVRPLASRDDAYRGSGRCAQRCTKPERISLWRWLRSTG